MCSPAHTRGIGAEREKEGESQAVGFEPTHRGIMIGGEMESWTHNDRAIQSPFPLFFLNIKK